MSDQFLYMYIIDNEMITTVFLTKLIFSGIFTVLFVYKSIADQKVDLGPLPSKKAALKVEPANSA